MYNCILYMHILSLGSESESTLVVCAPNQSLNSATKFQKGVTRSQTSQSGHHQGIVSVAGCPGASGLNHCLAAQDGWRRHRRPQP